MKKKCSNYIIVANQFGTVGNGIGTENCEEKYNF